MSMTVVESGTELMRQVISEAYVFVPPTGDVADRFEKVRALWDTGATHSQVTREVAERLGLNEVGCFDVNYGAGKSPSRFYEAGFMVGDICFRKMYVGECYGANRFDFVIGMDIISLGRFTLTGSGDERRMEFVMED